MSEGSKMGLFGSKDRNQEQKEKSSKDNSPTGYAPYGIDSDTETYDTEALSIMDINDIIGVQSGDQTVGDSTLESEIAALSQIITESKMESTSQLDPKLETQQDAAKDTSSSNSVHDTNIDNIDISNADESNIMLGKCATSEICETQNVTLGHTHKDVTCEKFSSITVEKSVSENTEMDPVITCDKTSDVNIKEVTGDTSVVCASELSSNDTSSIEINSSTVTLDDTLQDTVQNKQQVDAASPKDEKDIVEKTKDQSFDETNESQKTLTNTKSVVTVGGISKSLQLIGEAYNSEDSEETDVNDGDFLKETPSLSQETLLLDVSTTQQEKEVIEENPEINMSEQNAEKSPQLNDNESITISEESKVEVVIDNRTESPIISIEKSEHSSQSELLQQTLEVQENIDDSELNKTAEFNSERPSGMHEQNENKTEIDKTSTTEGISLEYQSSNKTSQDTIDTFTNTSSTSLMEKVNIDECQEVKNIDSELNISVLIPEVEKQDSSMISNEKELDTKEINDNCSLIDDNDMKDDVKDIPKDKDTLVESASETQDSIITEVSDKKLNMTETISRSDDSQEENAIIESCQSTQEITSITNKINDESQEAAVTKMDLTSTATASDNQDNMDLANAEGISVSNDKNTFQTTSSIINEELVLNENTSLSQPHVEEKDGMINEQSLSSNLLDDKNSDLCSTNLVTQSDTNSINNNNSVETIHTKEDLASESLIPVKHDESIEQLPSILEIPKVNDINDTVSNKLEDLSVSILHEDSSNIIENINEPLHETEKIEDIEMKISEVVSMDKNQSEMPETESQQICDQPESLDEKSDANNSTTQIEEDDITSSLCDTITERKEDKIEENVAIEVSNEKEIRENETFVPNLKEKNVIESEKNTKAETHEMNLVLESDISKTDSKSDTQIANSKDANLQANEEIKSCDENIKEPKKESKELIDANVTSIMEEKSVEPIEKSVNANDVQSNIINIINMSLIQENSNEGTNTENLTEKLSQDSESVDAPTMQTANNLEGLLNLNLISDNENSTLKDIQTEDKTLIEETLNKDVDMELLFDRTNESETSMTENSDNITNVITDCLTNRDSETSEIDINAATNDKTIENEDISLKTNKDVNTEPANEIIDEEKVKEPLEADSSLPQNDLDIDFEDNRLESMEDLEENDAKLELSQDILLESVMPREDLSRNVDTPIVIENSQSSSEISELESAVKFLQESEEQTIDSPLVLSPKMMESVVEDITKQANAELYVSDEIDSYANAESELANLRNVTAADSISISEAEIISEAAKLENERKFATQARNIPNVEEKSAEEINEEIKPNEETENNTCSKTLSENVPPAQTDISLNVQVEESMHEEKSTISDIRSLSSEGILKTCEMLPRVSILEERLKEPPKIEIPVPESAKVLDSSISPNDSLLIPKDARAIAYSRMLESPKSIDKAELKGIDTPRKDLQEKHSDPENVGSPRIILKIAKSAIADCSEPRSPKSPKIRSATNSPNPEDSPGQKLGKIKLKLSKGGHPSIISNENVEEINQWHTTENAPSLSPLGMKIKLSKSGDASIVGSEKYDHSDETKYKIEEPKRTDSPIGMKIKLSKSGDASIISDSRQQDCTKENLMKHKEKLEIPQGSPKRTESPIGMKIKLSKSGDASIIQTDRQESLEEVHREVVPKRTDSPIGMKIKLSKTGDASIVSSDACEDVKDSSTKAKEKQDNSELPKRTESPIGMKIKLSKCKGGASIISVDNTEDVKDKLEVPEPPKRTESPLGMKIKLSKTGDASIIHSEVTDDVKETRQKEKSEVTQDTTKTPESFGFKLKKTGEIISSTPAIIEEQDIPRSSESFTGVIPKIKVSKSADALVPDKTESTEDSPLQERDQQTEVPKRTESPLGMKIKLSKSGDASIVQSETTTEDHQNKTTPRVTDTEYSKGGDTSLGMKIKLFKTGDASVVEATPSGSSEKKDKQQRRREAADSPLEIKIKLSKTGHPTIVACDNHGESSVHKSKDPQAALDPAALNFPHRYMEHATVHKESALKILKPGHSPSILQGGRAELTIEPVQMQGRKQPTENVQQQIEISPKRKDITISPVESKKSKLEAQLSQILPEVTIQPVMCRDQKQQQQQQLLFDPKSSLISRQQMNVINQEISITQVRPTTKTDNGSSVNDKLKDLLCKNTTNSPSGSSDCEIIEHRPELIIVNENSNSSQDVVIIEEVTPSRTADIKVPKKRGRPRRNPIAAQQQPVQQSSAQMLISRDPLSLEASEMQQVPPQPFEHRENERPKRTCRNQKSYAPPKRGRGRGRGKRKLDNVEPQVGKKSRIDQDLSAIEASTMAVITIDETIPVQQDSLRKSSELYKALKQPPMDRKGSAGKEKLALTSRKETGKRDSTFKASEPEIAIQLDPAKLSYVQEDLARASTSQTSTVGSLTSKAGEQHKRAVLEIVSEKTQKTAMKQYAENKSAGKASDGSSRASEIKEIPVPPPGHSNWLTPTSKKQADSTAIRGETVSTVQVIDEETRMSAESGSRSQTPARNISAPASETIINEESQGSVLSTATTESEKVKVKNRRMEINFDPDEGPFTVDKIAEYEWPLDRKGETFMIQEQISQYLGVKSFKRKYPDLKRRVVDMEERNYLRENGLVSEAMCDMGLTAVCSSEVLDVMCSDFPDQYEEYRKHMREKQVKEHSKKQKELTAATNAEKNRIDLAEMAVQSAFAWNSNLNKARKENRKCCLDLQTFTIHVPKKQQKVDSEHKVGHYPVALIPGQYTDYYREYTPAELRYYPLNTVLYGPTRPNERKCDSQSEGSQSDSDSESSSDDSSSSSSEGTQDTEESQSTMDDVDMEISNSKDDVKLKCKMCLKVLNKHNKNEILIQCGTCNGNVHPSCIDLTLDMVPHIQSYAWQCTDCKTCAQCHDPADEDKMLFCDMCDRGYHIYCVGLRRVPQGRWHCQECAVCANCGSREAGGANSDRNSVAQWQHEYKKGEKNTRVYVSTLCVPCSKMRGDQGSSG